MKKVAIFNDTSGVNHYGCSITINNLIRKLLEHNLKPNFFWPTGKDWRPFGDELKKFRDYQAIIVNGEGSIHDSKEWARARFLAELSVFSKKELGIPAYLINATIFNNDKNTYENINQFKRIYVRESLSLKNLKSQGINSRIVPDMSLAYVFNTKNTAYYLRGGVMATDSFYSDASQRIQSIAKRMRWRYEPMQSHRRFLFFQTKSKNNYFGRGRSYGLNKSYRRYLKLMSKKKFFVTGRFHGVTFCFLTETSFVAIESNTPKISALLNDVFGNQNRMIHKHELKVIADEDLKNYSFSELEIERIRNYRLRAIVEIDNMIKQIAQDLK